MNAAAKKLLGTIVAFGAGGGFVKEQPALKQLKSALLVEVAATAGPIAGTDPVVMGVGARATDAGIALHNAPVSTAPVVKPTFTLVATVPVPESTGKRGSGKGKSIYPFAEMVVGQSFFIAATSEVPNPAKSLASTAMSATRRYDEVVKDANGQPVMETYKTKAKAAVGVEGQPDYEPAKLATSGTREKKQHTRVFVMRPVTDGASWGQPGVAGAGCFRTA